MNDSFENESPLYTSRVHKHFRLRCCKPAVVTFDDWACIQRWREQGIAVDCVTRGIDRAFACNAGEVTSLIHCAWAVEEVFRERTARSA